MRIVLLIFLFFSLSVSAQVESFDDEIVVVAPVAYKNKIYNKDIHTALLHPVGMPTSPPVLNLGSRGGLQLSFDDFNRDLNDINYTIIHCDANWKKSDLDFYRYANGIQEGYLTDYSYSRTMYQQYLTYSLNFPNEEIQLKVSGNYIIKVYKNNNPNDILLTQKFYIVENSVSIDMEVSKAFDPAYRYLKQEIDFSIDYQKVLLSNPDVNVKVALLQNWRWDNAITDLKPLFVTGTSLNYNYDDNNSFWGGNEQRFIDISNFETRSENVEGNLKRPDTVHVFTTKVKPKVQHSLIDRNTNFFGAMVIGNTGLNNGSIDAEYAMVYFYILSDYDDKNGDYYIFGGLSLNEHDPNFKMKYNVEKKRYERRVYLKQGTYNWHYHFVNERFMVGDLRPMEGSFSETLNQYTILVYYRGVMDDYDKLIGIKTQDYPTLNNSER